MSSTTQPHNKCTHQLFADQVGKTPDRIALTCGSRSLTYNQLNSNANQLANKLIALGVMPDDLIGICVQRSIEMIIGILSILKAGAAYVPMDPEYPQDRLKHLLEDSGIAVLLATRHTENNLPETSAQKIFLDSDWKKIHREPEKLIEDNATQENLIYAIYTSGSTGKPKGTLLYHKGFVNLLNWYTSEFEFGPGANVLLMSSTSFDLTQKNIFAPLIQGGHLVLLDTQIFDAGIIQDTIAEHKITSINCTPSAFNGLVGNGNDSVFKKIASLKQIFLGGEPIVVSRFANWRNNHYCKAQVINSYGPTECTDVCAYYRLTDYKKYEKSSVPIGYPICNTNLHILDTNLRPLANGEEGELCISGAGVGAGYLHRPDLTEKSFVGDPFSPDKSSRLYKTGDRARYLPDGTIEYLGRIDQQVKIRGFRIELGEVEAALEKHSTISEAVVVGRPDESGEQRLVAFLVPESLIKIPISEVRSFLQNELPDYMLPTAWVFLDEIPLTPNGKIDRNALPDPQNKRPAIGPAYSPPKSPLEKLLADIWKDILKFDKIGIHDPFFELGGTSIQSIQFIARIGQLLHQTIPIVSFFEAPTVSKFATLLAEEYPDAVQTLCPEVPNTKKIQNNNQLPQHSSKKMLQKHQPEDIQHQSEDIAVIGMAGRFPGAGNIDLFWENLVGSVESVQFASDDDLRLAGVNENDIADEEYIRSYFSAEVLDGFDAAFFEYQPREVESMDPQHRLFLELAWTALDNAGYAKKSKDYPNIAVFGGAARDAYLHHFVSKHPLYKDSLGEFHVNIGNDKNFPCARVAYKLDLKGPAVNVQTACSTSGVALHLACQNIQLGECDIAIVGGCRVLVPFKTGYRYVEGSALSSDGHLFAFDQRASGMVRGSGGACIILKSLNKAIQDNDFIRGVIKSTAINNDGSEKIGFTAPSVKGQIAVISSALKKAKIDPESIGYIEAHGTATSIGDPIEVMALNKAFKNFTDKKHFCYLGSIKTNIGHLDAGAAVSGIIKSLLAMETGKLPASLNYQTPNSEIDFDNSPFMVNNQLVDWHNENKNPRRCGVSSFGLGGTNFHTILEQAPSDLEHHNKTHQRPHQLISLSAKSKISLLKNIAGLVEYTRYHQEISLGDLAFSLNTLRPEYRYRSVLLCHHTNIIGEPELATVRKHVYDGDTEIVAFVFPAHGDEVLMKLLALIRHELQSHKHIDHCCQLLDKTVSFDTPKQRLHFLESIINPKILLFLLEYTIARLWMTWGVTPKALYGQGVGQVVASCICDSLSVSEGMALLQDQTNDAEKTVASSLQANCQNTQLLIEIDGQWTESDIWKEQLTRPNQESAESIPSGIIDVLSKHNINLFLNLGSEDQVSPLISEGTVQEKGLSYDVLHSYSNKAGTSAQKDDLTFTVGELWLRGQPINWTAYYELEHHRKVPLPPFQFDRHRFWLDLPGVGPHAIVFEAESPQELQYCESATLNYLRTNQTSDLSKLSAPFSQAAKPLHCSGFVFQNQADAIHLLSERDQQRFFTNENVNTPFKIAFMFPGGGAQYLRMGRGLYDRHDCFRHAVDKGLALFASRTGYNLKKVWFSDETRDKWAEQEMKRPSVQLPAIFILESAIAELWKNWGIEPDALIGHSLGENTAACLAGVLSYEDALGLVTLRGKLFEKTETGAMISIPLPPEELSPYLGADLDLATINSPVQCVVSGRRPQIEQLYQTLEKEDIEAHIIPINTAAHSRLLEPVLQEFGDYLGSIKLHPPKIPFISNTSGDWIKNSEATDPQYWVQHLRSTIRFADGLQTLSQRDEYLLLEAGPGKTLCSLVKSQNPELGKRSIPTLRHPRERVHDQIFLLNSITKLLVAGVAFKWQSINRDLPQNILKITAESLAKSDIQPHAETSLLQSGTMISKQPDSIQSSASTLSPQPGSITTMSRIELISNKINEIISNMSGIEEDTLDRDQPFLSMGFDSLFLTQANLRFKKTFKIKTTLKQLLRDAPTVNSLADFIDQQLPADAFQDELQPPSPSSTLQAGEPTQEQLQDGNMPIQQTMPTVMGNAPLGQAIALQIQASNALLACIQGGLAQQQAAAPQIPQPSAPQQKTGQAPTVKVSPPSATSPGTNSHGPYAPLQKSISALLTDKQKKYLADFIHNYTDKTKNSKLLAQNSRPFYADPRTVMGFKTLFKEMTYTIAGERSKGSRVWDIDGNEYVDCMGGFGAIFFGHAPDFVTEAVHKQLDTTLDYGPQTPAAERIARLICEFTGMERVSFCNTGSEATLAAMRIARTVTGNEIFVMFQGAYHGIFDEVLVRAQDINGKRRSVPVAPGIPESASENILILDYGAPESLEIIREKADDIAGVIIEPIQSRRPELQPNKFVQDLRQLTLELQIPMIFDEIITGFRLHPKGAQGWYGVDVDIACYGKVIGGGFPVGVIAGKKEYMDTLDGGSWNFGDDSFPEVGVTYFAGTFVRHPVALAAMEAVLLKFKEGGPALQRGLNRKTSIFAERVNRRYRQLAVPIELVYFGSVFLIRYNGNKDYEPLYWHHLRYFGAHHIWGNRPGFLTVAHTQEDMDFLFNSFEQAAMAMQKGGFLPTVADLTIETHPWTNLQSELWLAIAQGDAAAAAYNEQVMFEIKQDIDPEIFELMMDKVTNRHPSLRARVADDEQSLQLKHYMLPEFSYYDLHGLDPAEQQQRIQELAKHNIDKPFNFKKGPLLRTLLMKVDEKRNILCVCTSHLVCDGWSLEILMEDISGYYTGISQSCFVKRRSVPSLKEMDDAYKAIEDSEDSKESREFWLQIFADNVPPDLDLPLDTPRPRTRSFAGERQNYYLDTTLAEPLRQFAKDNGCTSFVLMLSVYLILLNKLTGQDDIVIGIPAAGQPAIGMPDLVSHNVSFLPLRAKIDPTRNFKSFLEAISIAFMDAKDNQDFAYGEILKTLNIPRDPSRLPLVTASFNMDMAYNPLSFDGVLADFLPAPRGLSKYDLLFTLTDETERILIEVDRNMDILEADTINRWIQHYECLLREILRNPNRPVKEIPMMGTNQQQMILEQWNSTSRDYALDSTTVTGLFQRAVEKYPNRIALWYNDIRITYLELDERANQLAQYLLSKGLEKKSYVGVCINRSENLIVILLAIWKTGCAYIPLDPDYPESRLQYMADTASILFLVTESSLTDRLKEFSGKRISIDTERQQISSQKSTPPTSSSSPEDLAYVIFTSGSTGKPKGVKVPHRAVANFLLSMAETPGISRDDILLAVTTLSFDIAALELFLPLTAGATTVLLDQGAASDGEILKTRLEETKASVMQATPATWRILLKTGWKPNAEFKVLCGGEAFPLDLVKQLTACSDQVWNMYGPTETTIWSSCHKISSTDTTLFIGRPIANTQMYVLDEDLNPMPIGVAGELYIGGAGISKGYINRPDLTKRHFIHNPFSASPEEFFYKTGDLARYHNNGLLECLGRIDSQVKVRGYRIELGEIEAVLSQHPAVSHSVVNVYELQPGDQRLVAYLISNAEENITIKDIRQHLRMQLPEYMIPQHVVTMAAFPLTPAGKIDRKALPFPDEVNRENSDTYTPPQTDTEQALLNIWQNILSVEKIGTTDNFFDLGGHSLLATQAIAQIKQKLKVSISLRQFFENPTIHGLANLADEAKTTDAQPADLAIPRRPERDFAVMSLQQQRLWYLDKLDHQSTVYNLPAAFRMIGEFNQTLFENCINTIFKRHDTLRTAIEERNGNAVQVITEILEYTLPLVDLSLLPVDKKEKDLDQALVQHTRKSYNLSDRPLFRATLYKMAENEHVFFFMPHHAIWDGWSFDVFLNELRLLYEAGIDNTEALLPPLPVQYADFAEWQIARLNTGGFDNQLTYWQKQLEGELPVLELHPDFARPAEMNYSHAESESFFLSRKNVASLRALARKEDATLFMTLFAAFNVLLFKFTGGQKDIIIGAPISGRNNAETADLLGFFVNTMVLRSTLTAEASFSSILQQVKETCLNAFSNQDAPFEKIIELVNPVRDLSRSPIFQIVFIFQDTRNRKSTIANLQLKQVNVARSGAQTDIDFWVRLTDDGLAGGFEYNSDLFETQTIQRMRDQYTSILEAIIKNPHSAIQDISALPANEYKKIIYDWNQTRQSFSKTATVQQLFAKQVAQSPEATAVRFKQQSYSYKELHEQSNQWAHKLIELGVKSNSLVGICLDRSPDMMVCLLGVLKAGAAYLPLDPDYPAERLKYMAEDSDLKIVLTQSHLEGKIPSSVQTVLFIDKSNPSTCSTDTPPVKVSPEDLAYIIYTSGSTGKPKGVQIPHRALANFLLSMQQEPGMQAEDTLLAVTTLSFDISALELFLPLISGATCVIADRETAMDGQQLSQLISSSECTVMQATPSTWRLLIAAGWQGQNNLKILCGGEAFPQDLIGQLLDRCTELWNMYGPTETTIWSTCWKISDITNPILIGRPIANTQTYILDAQRHPVPVGVPGELYISGAGVARGYLNKQDLTERLFIPDPFKQTNADQQPALMYRTGDRVRALPDGSLEYLERIDNQVKVRGFRIELGEIESCLTAHSQVSQAVVVCREDRPGDKRLYAYIVAKTADNLNPAELRRHLRTILPEYMLPQHFVELDSIPLTPAGKVDRRSLPAPESLSQIDQNTYVAPATDTEKTVAMIWQDVISLAKVGIHDNFFDIGGHSLLAVELFAKIKKEFGLELPLALLFKAPTIHELADHIDAEEYLSATETSKNRAEDDEEREEFEF